MNFKINYTYLLKYILILIPIGLVTGPFIPDLFASIIGLFALFYILKNSNYSYFKNKYVQTFILFFIFMLIASFFSDDRFYSYSSSLFYFRFIFFIIGISIILLLNSDIYVKLFYLLYFTFLIIFIDVIFETIFGYNLIGNTSALDHRISSFFDDELIVGSYIVRLTPLLLALLYKVNFSNNKINFILVSIFSMTIFITLLSGERTALFMSFLLIFAWVILGDISKYFKLLITVIIIFIIGVTISISNTTKERVFSSTIDSFNINGEEKYIFSQIHQSHYLTSINIIKDNLLNGIGPKMFRFKCNDTKYNINQYSCATHPHNFYIQTLLETGIPGFIILLSFYLSICILLLKHTYLRYFKLTNLFNNYQLLLMISIIINFFPIMPSGNLFNNWMSVIIYLPIGFLLSDFIKEKDF
ncbi:O-antigen ligase family protein [Alphaproteobacteria bacterium]|nr:O-antigen ligase family protein [Alphaproteobacteria bacterium]